MNPNDDPNDDIDVVEPAWMKAPVKWQEDDAGTPDREICFDAWKRLFGKPITDEVLVEEYDGGDTFGSLYEGGRVCINSCGLQEIRELPPSADKPVRGGSISPLPRAHKKPHFVSEKRDEELYQMTRLHLSRLISNEISGDEQLIKEVWEQTESDDERKAVKETLRGVLHFLDDGED